LSGRGGVAARLILRRAKRTAALGGPVGWASPRSAASSLFHSVNVNDVFDVLDLGAKSGHAGITIRRRRWQNPAMEVAEFDDIAVEFRRRIERTQWASMTTVDSRNRPRGRLVHPVWEEPVGWLATGRHSFKARHLEQNPFVSLAYWDQEHEQVYVECRATWVDDDSERQRLWQLYETKPEGYPLEHFFKAPTHPEYGLLRFDPWRIELWNVKELFAGTPPTVWRASTP
jgi:general stress protein 26